MPGYIKNLLSDGDSDWLILDGALYHLHQYTVTKLDNNIFAQSYEKIISKLECSKPGILL